MQPEGTFQWLGELLGGLIRLIVDALRFVFGGLAKAISDFSAGVAAAMGMQPSLFNFALLALGVAMLLAALRAFAARGIVAGIVWALLALLVLSALIG